MIKNVPFALHENEYFLQSISGILTASLELYLDHSSCPTLNASVDSLPAEILEDSQGTNRPSGRTQAMLSVWGKEA